MPEERTDHNYIDITMASQAADILARMFTPGLSDLPIQAADAAASPMPIIDDPGKAPISEVPDNGTDNDVYAIDGGSAVLAKGGNVEVAIWRAGYVHFNGPTRIEEYCPPPRVHAFNRLNARAELDDLTAGSTFAFREDYLPERLVDDMRWLAEWSVMVDLIEIAEPGTYILFDGALRLHPGLDISIQIKTLKRAAERDIHIVAVTKQSSLITDSMMPLDLQVSPGKSKNIWFSKISRPCPEGSIWQGDIYRGHLHALADKSYIVHISRHDATDPETLFAELATTCDDIEFTGYPYPLVAAHRLARIDNIFRGEAVEAIGRELDRRDFPRNIWDFLTADIHDKLNADIAAGQAYAR